MTRPESVNGNTVLASKTAGIGHIVLCAILNREGGVMEYVTWRAYPSGAKGGWHAESGHYFRVSVNAIDHADALRKALADFDRRA